MPREVITNPNYISDFANIAQVYYRVKSTQTEIWKLYFQNAIRWTKPVGTITAGVDFPFSQYGTITINRTSEDPYSSNGQISSGTAIRYGDSITATFTLPSDYTTFITIQKPTYSISHPTSSVVINNNTFNIRYVPWNGNNLDIDPLYWGYSRSDDDLILVAGVNNDNDFAIIASENDDFSGGITIIPANSADPQVLSIQDYRNFRTDSENNGDFVFYYGYPDYQRNPVVRSQQNYRDVACILTAPEFDAKLADNNQNTITASVTETVPYSDLVGSKTFRVLRWTGNSSAEFMRVGYTTGTMSKNFKMAEYPAAFNETTLHPRLYACSDYYPTQLLAKIPESNVVEVNIPWREGIITPSKTEQNTDAYYLENPNAIQVNYTFKGKHNETNISTSGTIQPDSKYFFTKINEYNSPRADVTFTISYTEAKDNVTYTHITEYKKGWYYAEHDVTTPPLDFDTRWDYDLNTGKYYYYINLQNNRTDGNTCRIASSLNRANAIDVPPNQIVRWTWSPTGTVTPSLGDGSLTVTGYYFYPENVWAKLTETFRLSHPYVSVPTLTLTAGTLGQVQYSLTNNDEVSREYNLEYVPYASPPTIVATGVCNGHATVTGILSNTDRETTTKPRFRAATIVKTWKSDYSDVIVGDTSFEPLEFHESSSTIAPISWTIWGSHLNHAEFD